MTRKVTHCEHASGRHPALPNDVENKLCSYLEDLSKRGFPLRPMKVRSLVYQFTVKQGYSGIGSKKTMTAGSKAPVDLVKQSAESLSASRLESVVRLNIGD